MDTHVAQRISDMHVSQRVRCRQIGPEDLGGVAALLCRGFPRRSMAYWRTALERLSGHPALKSYPRFGYMLECGGAPAGVLLTIFTRIVHSDKAVDRCNISSWYVEPAFRNYAPLLTAQAQKYQGVTYTNTSPADHTLALIEAQGFKRFTDGMFLAVTALAAPSPGAKAYAFTALDFADGHIPPEELRLLRDHHAHGCICLWCEDADGGSPFVFRGRRVSPLKLPAAHLVYCRSLGELSHFAGAVSRSLLLRGMPLLIAGTNGPIAKFAGRYFSGRRPMYYRGGDKPGPGDIAYSEGAIFGM